ncbi:hypothetical protein [Xanthomonas sp. SS]|uniref:hypothetical protein n=1 Tax=Xanthomonas sp. SS TaxID=2724122 RepID=UPI00163AB90F|nr:hypothetical protein [Xanthomonas sp. SS]
MPAARAGHRRRTLRIAADRIEAQFGAGNFDDAHEALIELLRECCGSEGYRVDLEIDVSHPNPWFHSYLLHLDDGPTDLGLPAADAIGIGIGIAEVSYRSFVRKVAELGLQPETV